MDIPDVRRETRYGMPQADQLIFNRHYINCKTAKPFCFPICRHKFRVLTADCGKNLKEQQER